jgi:hypothetical protein
MRSKGIKNFPDPKFSGGGAQLSLPKGLNPNSPQFKAAEQACKTLLPNGGPGGSTSSDGGPGQGSGGA